MFTPVLSFFFSDRHALPSLQLLHAIINMIMTAIDARDPSTPPIIAAVSTGVVVVVVVVVGVVVVMAADFKIQCWIKISFTSMVT